MVVTEEFAGVPVEQVFRAVEQEPEVGEGGVVVTTEIGKEQEAVEPPLLPRHCQRWLAAESVVSEKVPVEQMSLVVEQTPETAVAATVAGLTVIVISEVEVNAESEAERRITYVPEVENVAVVFREEELAKTMVPGPDTLLHVVVKAEPVGSPSSEAKPDILAPAGKVTVWALPAETTGVWLTGGGVDSAYAPGLASR